MKCSKRHSRAPRSLSADDAAMLTNPMLNLSGLSGMYVISPPADRTVQEGDVIEGAGLRFDVLDIPGDSPGHVVFVLRDESIVFGGDVLFAGSIGRTDFPGGSLEQLLSGIRAKLWPLPDATAVYPGHGPMTTFGEENGRTRFWRRGRNSGKMG